MGVLVMGASIQRVTYRLSQCPRCANLTTEDGTLRCKAYITRYAFGDEHPSTFVDYTGESDCEKFRDASSLFQFFEAPTKEEAIAKAVAALGPEVAETLLVVRGNGAYEPEGSGLAAIGWGETLSEAVAQARARIPSLATESWPSPAMDMSDPESGECDLRSFDYALSLGFQSGETYEKYRPYGLPVGASVEAKSEIEPAQFGEFATKLMTEEEVVARWEPLARENRLPENAEFDRILPGRKGFLGIGGEKTTVYWRILPKLRVAWRKKRAAFDFFVPVIVRVPIKHP